MCADELHLSNAVRAVAGMLQARSGLKRLINKAQLESIDNGVQTASCDDASACEAQALRAQAANTLKARCKHRCCTKYRCLRVIFAQGSTYCPHLPDFTK